LPSTQTQSKTVIITQNEMGPGNYYMKCYAYKNNALQNSFTSNAIPVQFNGPPPPNLHSVSLSPTSVKGGNNGTDPLLTVALDGPAPTCGQRVYVWTSNKNIAYIHHGYTYFTIPAGQTSDVWYWFLGTSNVSSNKQVNIVVQINGGGRGTLI
jgi:hypothetical protein